MLALHVTIATARLHRSGYISYDAASVGSIGLWNGVMLALAYDYYPPVTCLLAEAVAGWAIVGSFLVLLSLV